MKMSSKWSSSFNPPPIPTPESSSSSEKQSRKETSSPLQEGKRFLNLLKTFENLSKSSEQQQHLAKGSNADNGQQNNQSLQSAQIEILEILSSMESLYQRRGLFEYDVERAHEMMNNLNENTSSFHGNDGGGRGNSGKKRKRGGAGGGSSGSIASILGIDGGNSNSSTGKEAYILSNICRMLIPTSTSTNGKERSFVQRYPPVIISAACNTLRAICDHCVNHLPSTTATMEHSMIVSISSQVISGLAKTVQIMLSNMEIGDGLSHQDYTQYDKAISSSCNCASVLISISGIRLSRSSKIMENVLNAANGILWCESTVDDASFAAAKESAAALLSVIPLAGNTNGDSPSKLWTDMLLSTCKEFLITINSFYPASKRMRGKQKSKNTSNENILEWIEHVKSDTTSQSDRIRIFSMRIEGYMSIISTLLKMDRHHQLESSICYSLPIKTLLDILESMFSFCINAESKFLSTKPRLRSVSVEGGLLSPNAAITIANYVKFLANDLLQTVSSLLSSSALIHGNRIIAIVLSNLQSSSSYTLQSIIDPLSVADKNSKRKWLQSSVSLRTMAVQSISYVIQRLGSNAIVSEPESITKSITFVVGMVLEQISDESGDFEKDVENEHWGTVEERSKLVETCINVLGTCVSVCGGFLPNNCREMIESVTTTCMYQLCSDAYGSTYCNNPSAKISLLNLGINCITAPWSDGSASSIVSSVKKNASLLKFDRNTSVSSIAYTALTVCNCVATQRSPPLVIVSRDKNIDAFLEPDLTTNITTSLLEEGFNNAKEKISTKKQNQMKDRQSKTSENIVKPKKVGVKSDDLQKKPSLKKSDSKSVVDRAGKEKNLSSNINQNKNKETAFTKTAKDEAGDKHHAENKGYLSESSTNGVIESNSTATIEFNSHVDDQADQKHVEDKGNLTKSSTIDEIESNAATTKYNSHVDDDDDSIGDDFPMIVDCDPDDEDMD